MLQHIHYICVVWNGQLFSLPSILFLQPRQRVVGPNVGPLPQLPALLVPIQSSGGQVDPLVSEYPQALFQTRYRWPAMGVPTVM